MRYGMTTEELSRSFSEQDILRIYKDIGFDAVDYSYDMHAYPNSVYDQDDYLAYAKMIKRTADDAGISIHQMHAPLYHHRIDLPFTEEDQQEELFLKKMTIRGFEVAEALGCHYMVMHPRKLLHYDQIGAKEQVRSYNLQMFREYEELARKHNVQIALENMFAYHPVTHTAVDTVFRTAEEIVSYLDELNSDVFVACLDTGHANINGLSPAHMVKILDKYLKVLHIHDNYATLDQHMLCGYGTIDWKAFTQSLHDINFDGVVSLETCGMCENIPEISCKDYASLAFRTISNLVK